MRNMILRIHTITRCLGTIVLLCAVIISGHAYGMSDGDKRNYLAWLEKLETGDAGSGACWGGACIGVLAVAPNGCSARGAHKHVDRAELMALAQCQFDCDGTCEIKDVGGKSDFITQRGSGYSGSSGDKFLWCATASSVERIKESECDGRNGKSYSQKSQAETEHQRLKKPASNSGITTYCHNSLTNEVYKKSGNVKCSGSDRKITKQEYVTSLDKVWCVHSGGSFKIDLNECKTLNGKGFSTRARAQDFEELRKLYEELSGQNIALRSVGRKLKDEIEEVKQELEILKTRYTELENKYKKLVE